MKLRIQGNALRLRLNQAEVAQFKSPRVVRLGAKNALK